MSQSLTQAIEQFKRAGTCELLHGFAQDIGTVLPEPVDIVPAPALLHEVYSYGGGYTGLHTMMRTLPKVLTPGVFFTYRGVYAVNGPSLHTRVSQSYNSRSWLTFLRLFVPHYLPRHPPLPPRRRRSQARQNSRIVPVSDLHPATCAVISAPVGLFREIQRHYITFRGHVWRSGALGFTPLLDGADWLDLRSGHNDVALLAFLSSVEQGDTSCRQVWESWQLREGRETYAYMTLDQLLTAFVVHSAEADTDTVLLPVHVGDIRRIDQHYYNRSSPSGWPTPSPMPNSLCCFKTYPATMWPHCDRHSTRCPTTVAKPACPACIRRSTRETTGHDRGRTQAGTSRRHKTDSPSTQGRLPRDGRQHRNGHLLQPTRYRLL